MKPDDITMNLHVKIVANEAWNTSPAMLGRTGRVRDRDGSLFFVVLDGENEERYWAFAAELERA